MADWYCFKCKEKVEEVDDIKIVYGDMELPDAQGYRCPKCGTEYLIEELVVSELNSAEEMLELK